MSDVDGNALPNAVGSPARAIRGGSLLLVGRLIAIAAGIVIQVLIVRYLSQAAFGAFSYCIAVITLLTVLVSVGMEHTMSRFCAIYDEQGDRARLAGALTFYVAVVTVLGALTVTVAVVGHAELSRLLIHDPQSAQLLAVMVLLAPLQAIDTLGSTLFAVHGKPAAIFWRRYVLAPSLRIAAVAVTLLLHGSVFVLGAGYVVATLVGLLIYLPQLWRLLRHQGVLARGVRPVMPIRALLTFTGSSVAADLLAIVLFASDAIIVGWISGPTGVALLQATQPIANGNLVIFYAVIPMFLPMASRLFAAGDRARAQDLYGTCALWVAVCTFPVAALTIACALPVTTALFGDRYAAAAPILAIMAAGQYLLAVFGLSGLNLKAQGMLRNLAWANIAASVLNLGGNIVLVHHYGPLGAAVGTATCIVLLSAAKCFIARHELGVWPVDRRLGVALARIAGLTTALLALTLAVQPPLAADVALVVAAAVLLLWWSRSDLRVSDVFPEVRRVPALRTLLETR